ncbi:MAG: lipid-A-disaccharide synthase, partial [Hyphomicrobiales bacterium]
KRNNMVRIAVVAGEASGDHLGARLMAAIVDQAGCAVEFIGVGGDEMTEAGLKSIFPMSEIAVMGPLAILARLPGLLRRIRQTAQAMVDARPDIVVLVDCPEFSHRVARQVRARLATMPVIDYVAPSVWAWRPGRARAMRGYIDTVMALLPFEPDVYQRLGGPMCVYVGHSTIEQPPPSPGALAQMGALRSGDTAMLLVMPGSRLSEINRLMVPFGEAVELLQATGRRFDVVIPTLPHLQTKITEMTADWQVPPQIISQPDLRRAAMHVADAALVASGTATLELALAKTPMVVGYRTDWIVASGRRLLMAPSIVLANLVHGANAIPELFQRQCSGPNLARAIGPLMQTGPARAAQLAAFDDIIGKTMDTARTPSARAAEIVLSAVKR